jgi:hypothetical protein
MVSALQNESIKKVLKKTTLKPFTWNFFRAEKTKAITETDFTYWDLHFYYLKVGVNTIWKILKPPKQPKNGAKRKSTTPWSLWMTKLRDKLKSNPEDPKLVDFFKSFGAVYLSPTQMFRVDNEKIIQIVGIRRKGSPIIIPKRPLYEAEAEPENIEIPMNVDPPETKTITSQEIEIAFEKLAIDLRQENLNSFPIFNKVLKLLNTDPNSCFNWTYCTIKLLLRFRADYSPSFPSPRQYSFFDSLQFELRRIGHESANISIEAYKKTWMEMEIAGDNEWEFVSKLIELEMISDEYEYMNNIGADKVFVDAVGRMSAAKLAKVCVEVFYPTENENVYFRRRYNVENEPTIKLLMDKNNDYHIILEYNDEFELKKQEQEMEINDDDVVMYSTSTNQNQTFLSNHSEDSENEISSSPSLEEIETEAEENQNPPTEIEYQKFGDKFYSLTLEMGTHAQRRILSKIQELMAETIAENPEIFVNEAPLKAKFEKMLENTYSLERKDPPIHKLYKTSTANQNLFNDA